MVAGQLILLYESGKQHELEILENFGGDRPTIAQLRDSASERNVYVFPPDCSWTAVLHHEDWIPAYFAYAGWVT